MWRAKTQPVTSASDAAATRGRGGQVAVGVVIPTLLTFISASVARSRPVEAVLWMVASLVVTRGFVLFLVWFVATHLST